MAAVIHEHVVGLDITKRMTVQDSKRLQELSPALNASSKALCNAKVQAERAETISTVPEADFGKNHC